MIKQFCKIILFIFLLFLVFQCKRYANYADFEQLALNNILPEYRIKNIKLEEKYLKLIHLLGARDEKTADSAFRDIQKLDKNIIPYLIGNSCDPRSFLGIEPRMIYSKPPGYKCNYKKINVGILSLFLVEKILFKGFNSSSYPHLDQQEKKKCTEIMEKYHKIYKKNLRYESITYYDYVELLKSEDIIWSQYPCDE